MMRLWPQPMWTDCNMETVVDVCTVGAECVQDAAGTVLAEATILYAPNNPPVRFPVAVTVEAEFVKPVGAVKVGVPPALL